MSLTDRQTDRQTQTDEQACSKERPLDSAAQLNVTLPCILFFKLFYSGMQTGALEQSGAGCFVIFPITVL